MADKRDKTNGRFLPGNRFWEARSSAGPKPKFANPEDLWKACVEYFEWNAQNPLYEARVVGSEGKIVPVEKMRAMTTIGLCNFLDISQDSWISWRNSRADLLEVIKAVEQIIYQQKFEGASGGMLVANIIARDLGLADKTELTGKDGGPVEMDVTHSDAESFASTMAGLAARSHGEGTSEA